MRLMHVPTKPNTPAVPFRLPRVQALQSHSRRRPEKNDQIDALNQRVAPADERPRENPTFGFLLPLRYQAYAVLR